MPLQLFLLALAPSLFWLWWFWSQENGQREGLQQLARAFIFGALAVVPALLIEFLFAGKSLVPSTVECFLLVGPVEESCKLLATWLAVRKEKSFDQPADGIVYAAAAALGFAFAENQYYFAAVDPHTFILRAGLSVPMHALAAVPWAVALGRLRCDETAPKRLIFTGLLVSSILHGWFDALCFQIHRQHDIALLTLLVLTIFEWRLYVLSLSEMILLGKRLAQRRMFSSAKMRKRAPTLTAFKWNWFVLPMLLSFSIASFVWIFMRSMALQETVPQSLHVDLAMVSVLLVGLGLLVAHRSPGHTIRESVLALAISGFSLSFVTSWPSTNPLESGVYFAALGAFGSWLGEMLQDEEMRHSRVIVNKP